MKVFLIVAAMLAGTFVMMVIITGANNAPPPTPPPPPTPMSAEHWAELELLYHECRNTPTGQLTVGQIKKCEAKESTLRIMDRAYR